jgi:hypothetical protein
VRKENGGKKGERGRRKKCGGGRRGMRRKEKENGGKKGERGKRKKEGDKGSVEEDEE